MDASGWRDAIARAVGDDAPKLWPHLERVEIEAGRELFRHGEPSSTLYLVCAGELLATRGVGDARVELGRIGPGQWLGEVGLIDHGPATATVVATSPCVLAALGHAKLDALQTDDPEAAAIVLRRVTRDLAGRLRRSSSGVLERKEGGFVRVAPATPRSWWERALGLLFGGEERA